MTLSVSQQRIVSDLKNNGIGMAGFSELCDNNDLWNAISEYAAAFADQEKADSVPRPSEDDYGAVPAKVNKFLHRHFTEDQRISWTNPVLRMGIDASILDVVNSYLGLWVKLKKVHLWHTTPSESKRNRIGPQNWHRDPEDEKMVTVFLYFTDVDSDAGPLQYIPETRFGGRYHDRWPRFGGASATSTVTVDEITKVVPSEHVQTATCPRGTFVFCDTSGFHRGGFATKKPRTVAHWTYASPASLWPRRFSIAEDLTQVDAGAPAIFALR